MGKKPKAPDQRALVVGISNYLHPRWNALAAVAADVREIAAILGSEKRFSDHANQCPHGRRGEAGRDPQPATNDPGASISGRYCLRLPGRPRSRRCAGNTISSRTICAGDDLERTGIPLSVLRSLFEKCASRKLFLLLDFCYAGGILARGDEPNNPAALARNCCERQWQNYYSRVHINPTRLRRS